MTVINNNNDNAANNGPPDRRPSSPTEVVSPNHPSGCTCGCLHSGFPKAMYLQYQGQEVFTGILLLTADMDSPNSRFKLNDPNFSDYHDGDTIESSNLAGHGHVMTDQEFALELTQYDAQYDDPEQQHDANRLAATIKNAIPYLKDYPNKPHNLGSHGMVRFIKPEEIQRFSTVFPHGTLGEQDRIIIPQVRALDTVKVVLYKYIPDLELDAIETIWINVLAVTCTGMLVGAVNSPIQNPGITSKCFPLDMSPDPNFDLFEDVLVSFPVTCAYGVRHGKNW
jgi:hypothetical protein